MKIKIGDLFGRCWRLSLGTKILVGLVLGICAGIFFGPRAMVVQPVGDLFIRLLLMAAIPLVFFNLIAGITSLADLRVLGRYGLRTVPQLAQVGGGEFFSREFRGRLLQQQLVLIQYQ